MVNEYKGFRKETKSKGTYLQSNISLIFYLAGIGAKVIVFILH